MVSWIHNIYDVPIAPLESRKICSFRAGLDPEDQPSFSYCLLVDDALTDLLADIDDRIFFSSSRMQSKEVSKFLP